MHLAAQASKGSQCPAERLASRQVDGAERGEQANALGSACRLLDDQRTATASWTSSANQSDPDIVYWKPCAGTGRAEKLSCHAKEAGRWSDLPSADMAIKCGLAESAASRPGWPARAASVG